MPWDSNIEIHSDRGAELIKLPDLHWALEALERDNAIVAKVVEMHYFGGMTADEIGMAVGRSVHVVRHELRFARAWLRRALEED